MIGVIGPANVVKKIVGEISPCFLYPPEGFVYRNFDEVPRIVSCAQKRAQGLFFAGPIPYFIASAAVDRKCPWVYVPSESTGFVVTLLNAVISMKTSLQEGFRFSVDTVDENVVREILKETNLKVEAIYALPYTTQNDPSEKFLRFHIDLFRRGLTSFAVTCVESVGNALAPTTIPSFQVIQTMSTIRRIIQILNLEIEKISSDSLKAVVGLVSPRFEINETTGFDRKILAVHQALLSYSEKHDLLVAPRDHRSFRIIQNLGQLRIQTQNLSRNELFNAVTCDTGIKVDVGYGVGSNILVAERSAEKALEMATIDGGSNAYLIDNEKAFPIGVGCSSLLLPNAGGTLIIKGAGITVSSFTRYLHAATSLQPPFSSSQFSSLIGVTIKASRKIISILLRLGVIQTCGKRYIGSRGRPESLYRLAPDYQKKRQEIIQKGRRSANA
ncbi:MAG TPA: hypothetical protein DIV80_00635 [Synergistaceae bacterium]|nr:hypothetical protein [Synergistaceae bacterium]